MMGETAIIISLVRRRLMDTTRFDAFTRSFSLTVLASRRRALRSFLTVAALGLLPAALHRESATAVKSLAACKNRCNQVEGQCQSDCNTCCEKVLGGKQQRCDFGCGVVKAKKKKRKKKKR
jgi:hypothetical protein